MKQAVSTTTIFQLIIAFTMLFAAFLALAINYNKVYKLKNETISILEKYEGKSEKSLNIINNYLKSSGYTAQGNCEDGEYGIADLDNPVEELADDNQKYYYCLSYSCPDNNKCKLKTDAMPNGNEIYYKVKLFFKFDVPFLGDLFTFRITGETKAINLYSENQKLD